MKGQGGNLNQLSLGGGGKLRKEEDFLRNSYNRGRATLFP